MGLMENKDEYEILKRTVKGLRYEGKSREERRRIVEGYYNMRKGVLSNFAYLGAALGDLPAIIGLQAIQTIEEFPFDRNGSLETLLTGVSLTLPFILSVGKMVHNEIVKSRFCEPYWHMKFSNSS